MIKKIKILGIIIIILVLCFSFNVTSYGYVIKFKPNQQPISVNKIEPQIPDEWFTFMPRKIPFLPFKNIDYFKMYETPIEVSQYAGTGREYNQNYKPYYPEKYLYITDYSYNRFVKETKAKGSKSDNKYKYNDWLWEKIRSDFKKVHGMYNATITDKYGIKHKITWEDGGIVSIYEQYKLYFEYAITSDFTGTDFYKFLVNFRHDYPDVRVNSPFIEFADPFDFDYFRNDLRVYLYDNTHRYKSYATYSPEFQTKPHDGGVLLKSYGEEDEPKGFIGPDGKIYNATNVVPGRKEYEVSEWGNYTNNNIAWAKKIAQKLEERNNIEAKKDKLNVFLYYEIYDAFCRKYGYKYTSSSYTSTIPAKTNVKYTGTNYDKNTYNNFYNKYKDYITGAKAPSSEYLREKAKLEEKNINIEIVPEKKESNYYEYLNVNASDKQQEIEVDNVYKQKQYKVKPQPYSVEKTVSYYKKLNKTDIRMILEHLQNRLNTVKISKDSTSYGEKILTNDEVNNIYLLYEYQPEKFREYASELDKQYSKYYPQNMK